MRYELWYSNADGAEAYTLLEAGVSRDDGVVEPEARVVWSVEAETWEEARAKQHEYLGWEPYRPMADG